MREVYPGIDLVFYGNHSELEYDWVVAPGADPKRIRVKLDGDLVVSAAVRQRKPAVYQMVAGRRKEIEGGYSVRAAKWPFEWQHMTRAHR